MPHRILILNAGSSSIKVVLFECSSPGPGSSASGEPQIVHAQSFKADQDPVETLKHYSQQHGASSSSSSAVPPPIRLVVHRVVHGGSLFHAPTVVTPRVLEQLESLNSLAPLHNPPALRWIAAARRAFPETTNSGSSSGGAQHVCVFDTGFFHALPEVAREYALPRDLVEKHKLRRYGFHGIAHQAMMECITRISKRKDQKGGRLSQSMHAWMLMNCAVTLQLGSGASAAAILNGQPLDTSMGFSPLEGLVMATRGGDLDPTLLTFLEKNEPSLADPSAMESMLSHRAGLLGLSGGESNDMKTLESSGSPGGALACSVFMHRLVKYASSYVGVLGGLDTLVFGGGIGEHSSEVRAGLVERLARFLPVELDRAANERKAVSAALASPIAAARISTDASRIEVWVVAVNEAEVMLEDAIRCTQQPVRRSSL